MIEVKKITPTIGAMIEGVNFSEPIKENVFDQIYQILIENLVIFFRNTSNQTTFYLSNHSPTYSLSIVC